MEEEVEEEVEEVVQKVEVDLCQVSNWYRCTGGHLCQVSKLDPNVDLDGEIRSTKISSSGRIPWNFRRRKSRLLLQNNPSSQRKPRKVELFELYLQKPIRP